MQLELICFLGMTAFPLGFGLGFGDVWLVGEVGNGLVGFELGFS